MSQPTNPTPNPTTTTTTTNPLDLGITLSLHNWPALTMAVQSLWGGPTSSDKRDWLCGAISDMLSTRPETDAEDLEDVLIQVMSDEFDVVVDDESAMNVAAEIMDIRAKVAAGDTAVVQDMWEKWAAKGARKVDMDTGAFRRVEQGDDGEESDSESEDGEEDVEMGDAPAEGTRQQRERVEPEVDEDGFTKVVGKKKR